MVKNKTKPIAKVKQRLKKCPIKVPPKMKKQRTELQQEMFLELAKELWDIRSFLTHPKEAKIEDRNWETICHNVAFSSINYFSHIMHVLFKKQTKTCKKKK